MVGSSKIYYNDQLHTYSNLNSNVQQEIELEIKKAIAKTINKKIVKIVSMDAMER